MSLSGYHGVDAAMSLSADQPLIDQFAERTQHHQEIRKHSRHYAGANLRLGHLTARKSTDELAKLSTHRTLQLVATAVRMQQHWK